MTPETPDRRRVSLVTGREARLVTALAIAATLLGIATLRSLPPTVHWGLLDLREWRVEASPEIDPRALEPLQPRDPGQAPFHRVLIFERPPREGDRMALERSVPVSGPGPYCFRLWLHNPYEPSAPLPSPLFEAVVRAGDVTAPPVILEDHGNPVEVTLRGLEPVPASASEIALRVEIRALGTRSRASWRRASETRIQLADFWRCPGAES